METAQTIIRRAEPAKREIPYVAPATAHSGNGFYNDSRAEIGGFYEWTGLTPDQINIKEIKNLQV